MQLRNKVVVVTGGGSGMGRELVLELLRREAKVVAVDIHEKTLAETESLAGAHVASLSTITLDIADRTAVEALPARVIERFGAVDGVINNAGIIQPFVRLNDLDFAAIDRVFDVNWRGTLFMTKTFLPHLLARPEAHIVNISSMGGFLPVPGQTAYGASKAAVKLFTEGLHSEMAGTNVRVTVVFPGAIATNIAANSGVQINVGADKMKVPMTPPDRAAREILDGMEKDHSRVIVGKDARVLDALYRLAPERAAAFIAKQMAELLARSAKG